jgi:hypothetical protein
MAGDAEMDGMPVPYRSVRVLARKWDRQFESSSLQRRVQCEPDFRGIGNIVQVADDSRIIVEPSAIASMHRQDPEKSTFW